MSFRFRLASGLIGLVLYLATYPAHAAFIEYTPTETGVIRVGGSISSFSTTHSRPLTTIRGYDAAGGVFFMDYSSYLVYDVTGLGFTPLYGTLSFSVNDTLENLAGPGPLELWGLDIYTPADLIALPTGTIGSTNPAGDLRGGTKLAPDIVGPDGLISFQLNGAALTQITGSSGLFGVGLYDNRFGARFGGIEVLSSPTLRLSDQPIVAIPIPATPALLLLACVLLRARRRLTGN